MHYYASMQPSLLDITLPICVKAPAVSVHTLDLNIQLRPLSMHFLLTYMHMVYRTEPGWRPFLAASSCTCWTSALNSASLLSSQRPESWMGENSDASYDPERVGHSCTIAAAHVPAGLQPL
jgi:hypothetical protein